MSFKRFDSEDIVLSSELITFPTWYTQRNGDTDVIMADDIVSGSEQGKSVNYYIDYYSGYDSEYVPSSGSDPSASSESSGSRAYTGSYSPDHSKPLFSLTFAKRPGNEEGFYVPSYDTESGALIPVSESYVVYGQYRSLVLGDEYQDFTFGNTIIGSNDESRPDKIVADSFIAMSIDRSRFREKLDPDTCQIEFEIPTPPEEESEETSSILTLVPDTSANRRYLDAGRVFDLAKLTFTEDGSASYVYPEIVDESGSTHRTSYGYFLPDIGVILFNTSNSGSLFGGIDVSTIDGLTDIKTAVTFFFEKFACMRLRSQETVTSNFVFVRARNGEFNYSTNPSNIVGSAGNLRHNIMINQPQSFITTVGLYNDANELLAVAKLSRPLIKDFTKEALIRIKLDY